MAITRAYIKKQSIDNKGRRVLEIILTDGQDKKSIKWCGDGQLPDDNAQIINIVDNLDLMELWNSRSAIPVNDSSGNIQTSAKDFLDNLPNRNQVQTTISNISNMTEAKNVLSKMANAIFALKELSD